MTTGVLLVSFWRVGYGYAAFNLAVSIRFYSPGVPITLVCDEASIKHLDGKKRSLFTNIIILTEPVTDPGLFKAGMYRFLPYDYTLYLDVDALCVAPIEPLLDKLVKEADEGKFYRTHVYDWYDKDSPEKLPMMFWANRDVIWEHYHLTDEKLPATQSSLQFIKKCPEAEQLFTLIETTMRDNPIPMDRLRYQWGGTQPDELYLNVALAKLRICPDLPGVIWFCDNLALAPHQVKASYYFMSYFGVRQQIKTIFCEFYDRSLIKQCRSLGFANHDYKIHTIFSYKHASDKPQKIVRNRTPIQPAEPHKQGKAVNLFTTYFDAKNPVRQNELLACLQKNLDNPVVTTVHALSEIPVTVTHPKLTVINLPARPTMKQVVDYANTIATPEAINVMVNSDIYTNTTLSKVFDLSLTGQVLCLSRWDQKRNGTLKHFNFDYSQDTWIWQGALRMKGGAYYFGIPGCDNKFAYEVRQSGYGVSNPSLSITTIHLHNSGIRGYTQKERVPDPYLNVPICDLNGARQKRLLLIQPGKVGDIIICMPIAQYYINQGFLVEWQAPEQYDQMMQQIPGVLRVNSPMGSYEKVIDLSFGLNTKAAVHKVWSERRATLDSFVTLKYELSGVPLSELRNLKYERDEQKESDLYEKLHPVKPYKLVHRASDYGGAIDVTGDSIVEFTPVEGFTIFDWRKVIEQADEIHCIDSSLLNFVDRLQIEAKLFYYHIPQRAHMANGTLMTDKWIKVEQEVLA